MTLQEASVCIDNRHKEITQEDQHIERKTLDDYWRYFRDGTDPKNPFDFATNLNNDFSLLRKHIKEIENQHSEMTMQEPTEDKQEEEQVLDLQVDKVDQRNLEEHEVKQEVEQEVKQEVDHEMK